MYGLGAPPWPGGLGGSDSGPAEFDPGRADRAPQRPRAVRRWRLPRSISRSRGLRYSHIMDPRTGSPVQGVLGVAVLTNTGTDGDALDDAFFVLGPGRTPETDPTEPVDRGLLLHARPESLVEDDSRSCALSGRTTPQPARKACVNGHRDDYSPRTVTGRVDGRGSLVLEVLGFSRFEFAGQPRETGNSGSSRTSWNL